MTRTAVIELVLRHHVQEWQRRVVPQGRSRALHATEKEVLLHCTLSAEYASDPSSCVSWKRSLPHRGRQKRKYPTLRAPPPARWPNRRCARRRDQPEAPHYLEEEVEVALHRLLPLILQKRDCSLLLARLSCC